MRGLVSHLRMRGTFGRGAKSTQKRRLVGRNCTFLAAALPRRLVRSVLPPLPTTPASLGCGGGPDGGFRFPLPWVPHPQNDQRRTPLRRFPPLDFTFPGLDGGTGEGAETLPYKRKRTISLAGALLRARPTRCTYPSSGPSGHLPPKGKALKKTIGAEAPHPLRQSAASAAAATDAHAVRRPAELKPSRGMTREVLKPYGFKRIFGDFLFAQKVTRSRGSGTIPPSPVSS